MLPNRRLDGCSRSSGVIFLISFAHQPLTLGLVYGDPAQRDAHRRLYRWAPWVAFTLIVIGLNVSLSLVALMAGLWNAEHTLMQRYGVMRIYGRKAGDDNGRLEKPMLIVWLVAGIAYIGGYVDLQRLVHKLGHGRNQRSQRRPARRTGGGGSGRVLGSSAGRRRSGRAVVEGGTTARPPRQPSEALVRARHGRVSSSR